MKTNYIYSQIRKISFVNLIVPLLVSVVLIIIFFRVPFREIIAPNQLYTAEDIDSVYASDVRYINISFDSLYYTGYDYIKNGHIIGYYYYCLNDNTCTFVLVNSEMIKTPKDVIKGYSMKASLEKQNNLIKQMISDFSKDLNWTADGMLSVSSVCYINELGYKTYLFLFLGIFMLVLSILLIRYIVSNIMYMILPGLFPACSKFKRINGDLKSLMRVNAELNNPDYILCRMKNMIFTKHYFIFMNYANLDIIPLDKIDEIHYYTLFHKYIYSIHFHCANKTKIHLPYIRRKNFNDFLEYMDSIGLTVSKSSAHSKKSNNTA